MLPNVRFKPLWSALLIVVGDFFYSSRVFSAILSLILFLLLMDAMMEEMWRKFSLSKEEKGVLVVSSQDVSNSKQHAKFSILFKLQTSKDFNKEAFKSTVQKLWHGLHGVTVKEVGNNNFLAIFIS